MEEVTLELTNRVLDKLKDRGFKILSFGNSFINPFEEISDDYFNEIVNEVF